MTWPCGLSGLGKQYHLGATRERYSTLRDRLGRVSLRGLLRRAARADPAPPFWALKDVSFEVKRGEVVGIIGRNGAGKSTLLKVLSRITEPTEGEVDIYGRVGSLLEVGTGFHPELTGRENVYLNGAILGMRRAEIVRQFDAIVEFAEVEKFIDTPVKHYSSGMYMRLAFAVAAHLDPEILIVDEVLAVGDAQFQKKCLGKMGEVAKGGRTVLFVSHNMAAIKNLCSNAMLFQGGFLTMIDSTAKVVEQYVCDHKADVAFCRLPQVGGKPTVTSARILSNPYALDGALILELTISATTIDRVAVNLWISDHLSNPVGYGSLGTFAGDDMITLRPNGLDTHVRLQMPTNYLARGRYLLSLELTDPCVEQYDHVDAALTFESLRLPEFGRRYVLTQSWGVGSVEFPVTLLDT